MPIVLAGGRATHDVCGSTCVDWWRTRLSDERNLVEFLHESRRQVEVQAGRPDPRPFVPPKRSCTAASRRRSARELAGLLAEAEQDVNRRQAELRAGYEPVMLAEAAAAEAAALERRRRAVMRDDGPPELLPAEPRPEPREAAPVASEGNGEATETPRKRRPRRPAGFIDMIGTVPSSGRR